LLYSVSKIARFEKAVKPWSVFVFFQRDPEQLVVVSRDREPSVSRHRHGSELLGACSSGADHQRDEKGRHPDVLDVSHGHTVINLNHVMLTLIKRFTPVVIMARRNFFSSWNKFFRHPTT
jgi:hypothetical protein